MTGDNNGRWAGSYNWPDDKSSYILNIIDTIYSLRHHSSLILWCGGNELSPKGMNPNPIISDALISIMNELDPLRPFIMSSMSPQDSNPLLFDKSYALAPQVSYYYIYMYIYYIIYIHV